MKMVMFYRNRPKRPAENVVTNYGEYKPFFTDREKTDWYWELVENNKTAFGILVEGGKEPNAKLIALVKDFSSDMNSVSSCLSKEIGVVDIKRIYLLKQKSGEVFFDVEDCNKQNYQMSYSKSEGYKLIS